MKVPPCSCVSSIKNVLLTIYSGQNNDLSLITANVFQELWKYGPDKSRLEYKPLNQQYEDSFIYAYAAILELSCKNGAKGCRRRAFPSEARVPLHSDGSNFSFLSVKTRYTFSENSDIMKTAGKYIPIHSNLENGLR